MILDDAARMVQILHRQAYGERGQKAIENPMKNE